MKYIVLRESTGSKQGKHGRRGKQIKGQVLVALITELSSPGRAAPMYVCVMVDDFDRRAVDEGH